MNKFRRRRQRQVPFGWWPTTISAPTICGSGGLVCPPGTVCVQQATSSACVYPATGQSVAPIRVGAGNPFFHGGYALHGGSSAASRGRISEHEYQQAMQGARGGRNLHFGTPRVGTSTYAQGVVRHGGRPIAPPGRPTNWSRGMKVGCCGPAKARTRKRRGGILVGLARAITGGR